MSPLVGLPMAGIPMERLIPLKRSINNNDIIIIPCHDGSPQNHLGRTINIFIVGAKASLDIQFPTLVEVPAILPNVVVNESLVVTSSVKVTNKTSLVTTDRCAHLLLISIIILFYSE